MKYYTLRISLVAVLCSLLSICSAQEETTAYFKIGLVGTEVLDSTGEMVDMIDMMAEMMSKDIEKEYMVSGNRIMEYKTDVTGQLTSFSIYDHDTKTKMSYGELDLEKVYTTYDAQSMSQFSAPNGTTVTFDKEQKQIHGYKCSSFIMDGSDDMKMITYYTEKIPMVNQLPEGKEGMPLEIHMQMGGISIITGVVEHNDKLPHPEFFKVNTSEYKKVSNEEFPKSRGMF